MLFSIYGLSTFVQKRKTRLSFQHRLIIIITILFRESPTFLPSRFLILNSEGALLIGTVYETFITSETVIPEDDKVFLTVQELFENNYRIIHPNQTSDTNAVEFAAPEEEYRLSFRKHNINVTRRNFIIYNQYSALKDKIATIYAGLVYNDGSIDAQNVAERNHKWRVLPRTFDTRKYFWSFYNYCKDEYLGVVQTLDEVGITKHLERLTGFKQTRTMNAITRKSNLESGFLDGPKPISLISKLTMIFYVLMTLLLLSSCAFLFELRNYILINIRWCVLWVKNRIVELIS